MKKVILLMVVIIMNSVAYAQNTKQLPPVGNDKEDQKKPSSGTSGTDKKKPSSQSSSGTLSYQWKASYEGFWFQEDGIEIGSDMVSTFLGDDVIAYHTPSGRSFLMTNYNDCRDELWRSATLLSEDDDAFWRAQETGFWLVVKGEEIATLTTSCYPGSDIVAYYGESGCHYILQDYDYRKDDRIRTAEVICNTVIWKASEEGLWFVLKGVEIGSETDATYEGEDVIVLHKKTGISYRLDNYKNSMDLIFRTARILKK